MGLFLGNRNRNLVTSVPKIRPREPVLFAEDHDALVDWYVRAMGLAVSRAHVEGYHYTNLDNADGVTLGIAVAAELGIALGPRSQNSWVLQIEVDDVRAFLADIEAAGGTVTGGPSHDQAGFWFGSFADPEGNRWWVVDRDCP